MEQLGERIKMAALHERNLSNPLPSIQQAHLEEEKKSGTFGKDHKRDTNWPPLHSQPQEAASASNKSCSVTKTEIVKITNSMFMK
mmetsp:Transcript_33493/g.51432  ORF Transcript_33493/g.51432 Transcript_33493/m.51432 type:complete len:85 (-) Transcript_33493:2733-2987(-)